MIGRILICPFWFLELTLKKGLILANLKEAGKIEEQIPSLNRQHIFTAKNSFPFKIFTRMSESCTALQELFLHLFLYSYFVIIILFLIILIILN